MDIEYLISVFERELMLQRYSAGSIKNYSKSVRSFLQVAEKRFDQPDELNENEIEKYVYRKIRKDHISSSYQRFANVLFCAWIIFIFIFLSLCSKLFAVSFFTLADNG
jgi:site-specific recombinase XerD